MKFRMLLAALVLATSGAFAHDSEFPSIQDTMSGIIERLKTTEKPEDLTRLRVRHVVDVLTHDERAAMGRNYWHFEVNAPVVVTVLVSQKQRDLPFWLEEQGYTKQAYTLDADENTFDAWEMQFDAGAIGLGFSALDGFEPHYLVALRAQEAGAEVKIAEMYPKRHTVGKLTAGAFMFSDDFDRKVESVPADLDGALLLRPLRRGMRDTQLVNVFRNTPYPSSETPEQVVLTWSDDPKTTQTVQWRTSPAVNEGRVWFREAGSEEHQSIDAAMTELVDPFLVNDSVNHRFTATMTGLQPGASYEYRVGHGDTMTAWTAFETAPAGPEPFRFVYMGDAQNGLDDWGNLVHKCFEKFPDAKFYIMAGDLVNRGIERDDWDSLFHNANDIYDRRQLVPVIGNHECQGNDGPWMYLELFDLPKNGSPAIQPERSYAFEYGNVLFVVLDSNDDIQQQTAWLEERLASTTATWKFVTYHHPAYSSGVGRNNPDVREYWGALFDKYKVDLALQGHDHAYLRTYPMFGGERQPTPADGTIYIVSVSGTKHYEQGDFDYTEFGMEKVSTYQLLDIQVDGDKLVYKAYDIDGEVRDQFVIEK
ncbi:MAG: hypothetical protein GC168_21585 [Candidatus Hydrogenedens sp.]|nr:hypothetical protein [Candidatus Hydrogenedens sp.]